MAESLRFIVSIPKEALVDLALSEGLGETIDANHLCSIVREAVIAGFEEYLGEGIEVEVKPG